MQDMQDFTSFGGLRSRLLGLPGMQVTGAAGSMAMTYANGLFVTSAAPNAGTGSTSVDGKAWASRTWIAASSGWSDVCGGPGMFVSLANNSATAASSPDGVSWTQRALPIGGNWYGCTYGTGKFVAVGGAPGTLLAYSSDGVTWSSGAMPTSRIWYGVAYGAGTFVAVAAQNATGYATSPDGINWTNRAFPVSVQPTRVRYLAGMFVVPSATGNVLLTSSDGLTWGAHQFPLTMAIDVAYCDGLFTVLCNDGRVVATVDFTAWHTLPSLASGETWQSIAAGAGRIVAASLSSIKILTIG